jgi:hemolysin activation/secretion protein
LYSRANTTTVGTLAVDWKQGIAEFGATAPDDPKLSGRDALGTKLTLDASVSHSFRIAELSMRYQGSVSVQQSTSNLLGEEQVSIGGPSSVRGAPGGVFSGNNGGYLRNELSMAFMPWNEGKLKQTLGVLEPYVALDYGHINGDTQRGIAEGSLLGAAIGLRSKGRNFILDLGYESILQVQSASGDAQKPFRWYFTLQLMQ